MDLNEKHEIIECIKGILNDMAEQIERGAPQVADIDIDEVQLLARVACMQYFPDNKHLQSALHARLLLRGAHDVIDRCIHAVLRDSIPPCSKCGMPMLSGGTIDGKYYCSLCYETPPGSRDELAELLKSIIIDGKEEQK